VQSLLQEVEVLDKSDVIMSNAAVRCHYGVKELMICFIKETDDKVRRSINANTPDL
jgi:hypothetical protein